MEFGNWIIAGESIEWNQNGLNRFVIPKDSITAIRYDKKGSFFLRLDIKGHRGRLADTG